MHATLPLLNNSDFPTLHRQNLEIVQINLGYLCNLSCVHCHVNAGPKRTELMDKQTIDSILAFTERSGVHTLDLTGGAPEMNPFFEYLVLKARALNIHIIDRCNLVILRETEYRNMGAFLAAHKVEITASLPCYLEDNVNKQRGKGVFQASIDALQSLNELGYGVNNSELKLNLVYNPQGPQLPPDQLGLEQAYKEHLQKHYGIFFNHLFALTNMPIQRFGSTLISQGKFNDYMQLLKSNYRADNLPGLMCRNTISIDWQGYIYDCDFNQMLELPLGLMAPAKTHISELNQRQLQGSPINVRQHCYGCTAGQGSSCGGAID